MNEREIVETLGSFALFADLSRPELEAVAHRFDEQWFGQNQRVIRQGFSGVGFHVVLEGEASVQIDGEERVRLGRGDFFGELSILLDEPPNADIVAVTQLHCLVLPRTDLQSWLLSAPGVTLRMLQAELRRLRIASTWRS